MAINILIEAVQRWNRQVKDFSALHKTSPSFDVFRVGSNRPLQRFYLRYVSGFTSVIRVIQRQMQKSDEDPRRNERVIPILNLKIQTTARLLFLSLENRGLHLPSYSIR